MRARFKSFEEMPEHYKCCESRMDGIKKRSNTEIEISGPLHIAQITCIFCGRKNIGRGYFAVDNNLGIFTDMVDIDEGA